MSAAGKKAAPGAIDLESLRVLAAHHLSKASKHGQEFTEPWPGSMAIYLLEIDDLVTEIEDAADPVLGRSEGNGFYVSFRCELQSATAAIRSLRF